MSGLCPLQKTDRGNACSVAHAASIKIAVYHKENSNGTDDIKVEINSLAAFNANSILLCFAIWQPLDGCS